MEQALRIGICGVGSWGTNRARMFRGIDGVEVTLGWSRSEKTRSVFANEMQVPTVDDWRKVCESPELDAVVIATPNVEHFEQARTALASGKHVLAETPLALSHADARVLADTAERMNVALHHGMTRRYHPDHAKHVADLKQVGRLLFGIQHAAFDFGPDRPWYGDLKLTGGARAFLPWVLQNWLQAFGEVSQIAGAETACGPWTTSSVTVTFAAGGVAEMSYGLGLGIPGKAAFLAEGDAGCVEQSDDGKRWFVSGESKTEVAVREVDTARCECQAFVDEARGLVDYRPHLAVDLLCLELLDKALGPNKWL